MSITNFYLVPLEKSGNSYGPAYLHWKYNKDGVKYQWSLKNFNNDLGLLATRSIINNKEYTLISKENKNTIKDVLLYNKIDYRLVSKSLDYYDLVRNLAVLTQCYQADVDKPNIWNNKNIYFGFTKIGNYLEEPTYNIKVAQDNFKFNYFKAIWQSFKNPLLLPFSALPATDAFTGTNGTVLSTYSANWTLNTGSMIINTNAVAPNTSANQSQAHWNADSFNNNQYSQFTVSAISPGVYVGPVVRAAVSGVSGYYIEVDSFDGMYFFKFTGGSEIQLGSKTAVAATNDILYLEANGTTITPKKNGSTTGTPGAQTDSSISSGSAGLNGYEAGTGSRMDTWEGGNITAPGKAINRFYRKVRFYRKGF